MSNRNIYTTLGETQMYEEYHTQCTTSTHTHCRKLTLQSLHWSLFEKPEEHEANCRSFIQLIQEQIKPGVR